VPASVVTPDVVETSRGTFEFKDGVPTDATAQALYDQHDFTFAYRAFMDTMRGVSTHSLRKGMEDVGVKQNEVMVFSELMDAKSLFLTPNADTIYDRPRRHQHRQGDPRQGEPQDPPKSPRMGIERPRKGCHLSPPQARPAPQTTRIRVACHVSLQSTAAATSTGVGTDPATAG
jgi:hypothetical protein